ncbi:septum formation protein Maf [Halobacteriovorax marinus]|nr:septum formation protein Maf [Halobacteriovorax marinus]
MKLILASSSPRRRELLGWLNIPFEIVGSGVEEITEKTIPTEVATDLAALKGRDILDVLRKRGEENPFIIASDTIVTYEDKIYGKPKDVSDAKRMLLELEGKRHSVVTGVYLSYIDDSGEVHERIFSATSQVTFEKIDRDILDIYLESGESLDKAGAYGIQGRSLCFISKVEGSYSNVVGFPISDFLREFKDFLGHANSTNGEWRELFEH